MPAHTKLTYEDYLLIPDDGRRHEILDGEHVVNAAPVPRHQRVLGRLYVALHDAIDRAGLGEVFLSPIDVHLSEHDVVQPDLVMLLHGNAGILTETKIHGSADLLVEILSPSTRSHDRVRKKARYEAAGVPQYWIVDPVGESVEDWRLVDGRYTLRSTDRSEVTIAGSDVRVDLAPLWAPSSLGGPRR